MALKDIFNSLGGGVAKVAKPIGEYFYPEQKNVPTSYVLKNRGVEVTDADLQAFKPLLYGEVSNRGREKKDLEAGVIFNTILNRMKEYERVQGKKRNLRDVISMPNQYQAYRGKQYPAYFNSPDPIAAEKKKEVDAIVETIRQQLRTGEYPDTTEGAYYYVHDEPTGRIYYDNKKKLFAD